MSMQRTSIPKTEPEILTPEAQRRLREVELRHEGEAARLANLESLANLMDAKFRLPFVPVPIGLDFLVGLIPGVGDTISMGISGYIILGARNLGVPKRHLTQMGGNTFLDWLIGLVPVIGDLFDIGWRGNIRNVTLAREHLERRWEKERAAAKIL